MKTPEILNKHLIEKSYVFNKLVKRKMENKCIGCGHQPCTCKTKGKIRNRTKGIGRSEVREPSQTEINYEAEQRQKKK